MQVRPPSNYGYEDYDYNYHDYEEYIYDGTADEEYQWTRRRREAPLYWATLMQILLPSHEEY